jgi:hypothetical protein
VEEFIAFIATPANNPIWQNGSNPQLTIRNTRPNPNQKLQSKNKKTNKSGKEKKDLRESSLSLKVQHRSLLPWRMSF